MGARITGLWGGACLAVGCNNEFVSFYDWVTGQLIQRVDGNIQGVSWSEDGKFVMLHSAQASYLLEFHADRMAAHLGENPAGVEGCLEVLSELDGSEQSGVWYKHAYLYVSQNKLQVVRGEHTEKLAFVPAQRFLLRYIPSLDLVFFADARCTLYGYSLDHALLDYECAVVDQDFDLANQLLAEVSASQYDRLARFLDVQGFPESAVLLAQDADLRFELNLKLGNSEVRCVSFSISQACRELLTSTLAASDRTDTYNPQRWRRLADLYIAQGQIEQAENCAQHAGDLAFSLLLLSCLGDRSGLRALAASAQRGGQLNVAFLALYLAGDAAACLKLLQEEGKLPEAAFFSLSYLPSQAHAAFTLWREKLRAEHHIAAELLADPATYGSFFAGLEKALALEKALEPLKTMNVAAEEYSKYREMIEGEGLHLKDLRVVKEEEEEEDNDDEKKEEEKEEEEGENVETMNENGETAKEPVNEVVKETQVDEEAEKAEKAEEAEETSDEKKGENLGQMSSPNLDEEFGELLEGATLPQEDDEGDIDIEDLEREWNQ